MFSNSLVCDLLEYINKNINDEITIDDLSNRFYFNKTYIMKRFKREIGYTIHDYINTMRIMNSLDLYGYDNYILGIAIKNGFNSIEYYSEMFKNIIGVSPLNFRQMFSILSDKAENTKNIEELVLIRDEFEKIKDYQNYLDNFSADFINDGMKKEKPKVMIKLQ